MRNIILLVKLYFTGFLRINQARRGKGNGRARAIGMAVLIVALCALFFVMLCFYFYFMGIAMDTLGRAELMPVLALAAACIMTLLFSISQVGPVLFQFKDYDLQMSLPIPGKVVASSRLLIFYIQNLAFTLFIMLPALGAFAVLTGPGVWFYVTALTTLLFIPALPVIIGTVLGLLVSLLAARFRMKNLATVMGMLLLLVVVVWSVQFSMNAEAMEIGTIAAIGQAISAMLFRIYPPARLYYAAVFEENILSLLVFLVLPLALSGLYALLVGKWMPALHTALTTTRSRTAFRTGAMDATTPLMALYKRDIRRYFASPIYVMNTMTGPLLLLLLSGYLALQGGDMLAALLPELAAWLPVFLPLVPAVLLIMGCTTGVALSMDGPYLEYMKGYPLRARLVLWSKLLVNLTFSLPTLLISVLVLAAALGVPWQSIPLALLIGTGYVLLISALGLLINLYFPKLEWNNETEVVKRSLGTFLTNLCGMLLVILPGIALYAIGSPDIAPYLLLALLALGNLSAYLILERRGEALFFAL